MGRKPAHRPKHRDDGGWKCACGWLPSATSKNVQYRQVTAHDEIMKRDAWLLKTAPRFEEV